MIIVGLQDLQVGGKDGGGMNVMPVPSPQPIQYFSGQLDQEVVIQKQPNRNFMQRAGPNGGPRGGNGPRMRGGAPQMPPGMMPVNGNGMSMTMEQQHMTMNAHQYSEHISGPRLTGESSRRFFSKC